MMEPQVGAPPPGKMVAYTTWTMAPITWRETWQETASKERFFPPKKSQMLHGTGIFMVNLW